MTRALNAGTRVQRGSPDAVSPTVRKLGYEPSDARPGRVLLAMAAFASLLALALGVGALLLLRFGKPVTPTRMTTMPAPQLLADPLAERLRIEAAARGRVDEARLRRAMHDAGSQGWEKDGR